jgi:phosphatidylglycerol:prolipoprotein diacylglycerol transferase
LEGLILLLILQRRFWKYPSRIYGKLTADFLCLYAVMRIFAETFREPDAPLLWQLSRGQVLSLCLGLLGIGVYFWTEGQGRKSQLSSTDGSAKDAGP